MTLNPMQSISYDKIIEVAIVPCEQSLTMNNLVMCSQQEEIP